VAATDADVPGDNIRYRLNPGVPAGMRIDVASGWITWETGEATGPATVVAEVVATDDGVPAMSATNRLTVVVREVNQAPFVWPIAGQVVSEGRLLEVSVEAEDNDIPAQTLAYRWLETPPRGAVLNAATGAFQWRPDSTQGPSTNRIRIGVSDGVAESEASFVVVVRDTEADFRLALGETLVFAGADGAVPVSIRSQLDLASVTAQLRVVGEGVRDLMLVDLAGVVGNASLVPVSESVYALTIEATLGGSLRLDGVVATLRFGSDVGATSEFVRLVLSDGVGWVGGEPLNRAGLGSGRVILVGEQPLVEAIADRTARLYGHPGVRYRLETSARLEEDPVWMPWREELMTLPTLQLPEVPEGDLFLRAVEVR
jgi:hypothetical protein